MGSDSKGQGKVGKGNKGCEGEGRESKVKGQKWSNSQSHKLDVNYCW